MPANNPSWSNVPEERVYRVGITGAGSSDPTKRYGQNIAVTRSSAGVYKFTWTRHPGYFRGWTPARGATTPADLKLHDVVRNDYNTSTNSIEVTLYDASGNAHDLETAEYLDLTFVFTESSAG